MGDGLTRRQLLRNAALGLAAAKLAPSVVGSGVANASPVDTASADLVDAWEGTFLGQVGSAFQFDTGVGAPTLVPASSSSIFWAGQDGGPSLLKPGDSALVRTEAGVLDRVWANLTGIRGRVQSSGNGVLTVQAIDGTQRAVDLRLSPVYANLFTGDATPPGTLPVDTYVDLAGYESSGDILASVVSYEPQDASVNVPIPSVTIISGGATRTYVYHAIASRFSCPTGKGRCGTCNTASSLQCAYPALDSSCNCCSPTCCNCAKNCVNMVYLSCGDPVTVYDWCTARRYTLTIADCGPCANPSCHTLCSATTCSHVSSCGSTSLTSALVDLTFPTFARFDNPSVRTSFPCDISVTVAT